MNTGASYDPDESRYCKHKLTMYSKNIYNCQTVA